MHRKSRVEEKMSSRAYRGICFSLPLRGRLQQETRRSAGVAEVFGGLEDFAGSEAAGFVVGPGAAGLPDDATEDRNRFDMRMLAAKEIQDNETRESRDS
jgi:hypothetical protein